MLEQEPVETNATAERTPKIRPPVYKLFIQPSQKLGEVATHAFLGVKQFLKQDIVIPPPLGRLLSSPKRSLLRAREDNISAIVKLKKIVLESHEILARADTVFPITLFPDTLIVDRTKITICKRNFFWSADTISIRIEDVLNVSTSVGPVFGSVTIASRVMSTVDHFRVNMLWRKDVVRLKYIIQGYIITQNNHINTAHLSLNELVTTLTELGQDSNA